MTREKHPLGLEDTATPAEYIRRNLRVAMYWKRSSHPEARERFNYRMEAVRQGMRELLASKSNQTSLVSQSALTVY